MARGEARSALVVLLLALLAGRSGHGYALMAELRTRAGAALDYPEGSVYPALQQMERSGLVRSSKDVVDGRSRRVYEITEQGLAHYAEQRESWLNYVKAMTTVLEG